MTSVLNYLVLLLFVFDGVRGYCLYFCSDDPRERTLCAVDPNLGPRLFRSRCHMRRTNHCQTLEYEERNVSACLESDAVARWVAGRESARQFDARRAAWAVPPFRRFFLLFNILTRLMLTPPPPPPRFTPGLGAMPFPFPFVRGLSQLAIPRPLKTSGLD